MLMSIGLSSPHAAAALCPSLVFRNHEASVPPRKPACSDTDVLEVMGGWSGAGCARLDRWAGLGARLQPSGRD